MKAGVVLKVVQADREAAMARDVSVGYTARTRAKVLRGDKDEDALVQAFARHRAAFAAPPAVESKPIPMILYCPKCHEQHVDEPDERTPEWNNPPHRSHLCHACGCIWRPADMATEGVRSIKTAGDADTWGWDGASVKPTLHPSDREAIARVIDPMAWSVHEKQMRYVAQVSDPEAKRWRQDIADSAVESSLAKADAILALSGSLAPESEAVALAVDLAIGEIELGNSELAHSILCEALKITKPRKPKA